MSERVSITSVEFDTYKALENYSVRLSHMNILVGPNNSGKSTVLGVFRVLAQALRRARSKRADRVRTPEGLRAGWQIPIDALPVSVENVHTDYVDADSLVVVRTSNRGSLNLFFPAAGGFIFYADAGGEAIRSPVGFTKNLPVDIQVVPVLGPLEHEEVPVTAETVRKNLSTTRASRNFRNYWRHNPGGFDEFSAMIASTWPGMEIQPPEVLGEVVAMFCLERRITRELFWSGFGFQIWCQLLSHIFRAANASLIVVDEPEVYLHPDVQRRLLGILRDMGPDILMATHSTEIMSEADPSEIILIDKTKRRSERLKDIEGVQSALESIGSIQNITLTRLARNRKLLFFEGASDFQLVRRFARKLGLSELAAGTGLTTVEAGGFSSWEKVRDLASGFETTLGVPLSVGAVFDRDYWCAEEIRDIMNQLTRHLAFAHIHERKEVENYLLVPDVLQRATEKAIQERARRSGTSAPEMKKPVADLLRTITNPMKSQVQSQYISKRVEYLRRSKKDDSSITADAIEIFEPKWNNLLQRMELVPGKKVLARLRDELRTSYSINLTDHKIVSEFETDEIPHDLVSLLGDMDGYRSGS